MRTALPIRLFDENRGRRVAELLIVLCVLSLADLIFTIWAQVITPKYFLEMNPLAQSLLSHHTLFALVVMKVMLTGLGASIFWHLRKYWRAELGLWIVVGVYVMLTFRWNTYTVETLAMLR